MKALLHFSPSSRLTSALADISDPYIVVVSEKDDVAFEREIVDTDILLHVLEPVTDTMMAKAPRLKLIQKIGVGVNTIDCASAKRRGVAVTNMPGINTTAVAEHTLALMLATLRRIAAFDAAVRQNHGWSLDGNSMEALGELNGSTVGLVGYGAVARKLSAALATLGASVQFWSRTPCQSESAIAVAFETLLASSDIISLHLPLTPETKHLLDSHAIGRMKSGVVVVNTARGGLIDQAALIAALRAKRIAGAGLDVFAEEPLAHINPLLRCPNVVLTPHVAWLTPQTLDRSLSIIVENCRRLRDGESLLNRVDD